MRHSMAALLLIFAIPITQPLGQKPQTPVNRGPTLARFMKGEVISQKASAIAFHEPAVLKETANQVQIEGWELVSEKTKSTDGTETVTTYPRTVINSDIDKDGAIETVTLHKFLEMNTTLQTFQVFRIHFLADVNDPGPTIDSTNILEAAKAAGGINLLDYCSIVLANQAFFDPSMDYRYYLNDDSIFFSKGDDAYNPVQVEVSADAMTWTNTESKDLCTFSRKTFTSASLEDLVP